MFDVQNILQSGGLLALAAIVFAESGMLIGFFLPGDTLLLSAGLLAAQGHLPIFFTIFVIALAAIIGDNTGYAIGRAVGPRIYKKKDGVIFRQAYLRRAEAFFDRHGSKTMLLAHFIPYVRSFAPIAAGVAKMPRWQFVIYDAIGVIVWAAGVTLLGYWFGSKVPNLDHYILPVLLAVIVLTCLPMLWHLFADKTTRQRLFQAIKSRKKIATPADSEEK